MATSWFTSTDRVMTTTGVYYKPRVLEEEEELRSYEALSRTEDGKFVRRDKRSVDEIRSICNFFCFLPTGVANSLQDIKSGIVSHASGSAYIEMNNTKVICSVYVISKELCSLFF